MTPIRPAAPGDLPAVAALVADLNSDPASRCLHCEGTTPAAVRAALRDPASFPAGWHRAFVVATGPDGEIVGALGFQLDADQSLGWLWGPWLPSEKLWPTLAPRLLNALLDQLPRSVHRLEAFLHAENRPGLNFLRVHGFSPGPATHIYVAPRGAWTSTADFVPLPLLRAAHEVAFGHLHSETFPAHGCTPARELMDARDDEHVIFAATDGLRLLGSVCVSVNQAPAEGFIDYLAVKPVARGRGVGSRLLQTALHWTFSIRNLPQAALCVTNWRDDARRLYERAGFTLQATGIAMRRNR